MLQGSNGPAERCKLALTQRSQILPICNFLIKSSQEAKIYTPYYILSIVTLCIPEIMNELDQSSWSY